MRRNFVLRESQVTTNFNLTYCKILACVIQRRSKESLTLFSLSSIILDFQAIPIIFPYIFLHDITDISNILLAREFVRLKERRHFSSDI